MTNQAGTLTGPLNSINPNSTWNIKNVERQVVLKECEDMANATNAAFTLSGLATGVCACLAITAAVGLTTAVLVTPVGWAALGLVGVGLAVLAVRHVYMSRKNIETDTTDALSTAIGYGLAGVTGRVLTALGDVTYDYDPLTNGPVNLDDDQQVSSVTLLRTTKQYVKNAEKEIYTLCKKITTNPEDENLIREALDLLKKLNEEKTFMENLTQSDDMTSRLFENSKAELDTYITQMGKQINTLSELFTRSANKEGGGEELIQ